MTKAASLDIPARVEIEARHPVDLSAAAAAQAMAAVAAAHERARSPSWQATSVTAELKRLPRIAVEPSEAGESIDPTRAIVPDKPSHRADAGMAWGTLVHGLLEHAMRHPGATRQDLRRLAMWLTMDVPDLRAVVDQALDTVEAVSRAGFWREARLSAERHEEVPFAVRDDSLDIPRVVTGAIDLAHRTDETWQVVDYKTDLDLGNADAQRRYDEQIHAYGEAWARITGSAVKTSVVAARKP
jgi:ATP-dependent exoDNAse (exonuclease V) beta subunit